MGMDSSENGNVVHPAPKQPRMSEEMEPLPDKSSMEGDRPDEGLAAEGLEDAVSEQALKGIIEALLFVSGEPLPLDKLTTVLAGPPKVVVHNAVKALQEEYDREGRGLHIAELAGGFIMMTQPDCAPWITRLHTVKASARVSRSALETLAIIAYKQPIVRADIERIRGVETTTVLRTLLEQKLIRIVGRQDVPGRPILYGTSKVFLQKFGLRDLQDLPPLRDFKELAQGDGSDLFGGDADGTIDGEKMEEMTVDPSPEAEEQPVASHLDSSVA